MRIGIRFPAAWLQALLCLLALAGSAAVRAGDALVLDDSAGPFDPWPVVTAFADPEGRLGLDAVRARHAEFARPEVPRGNFGQRKDALWLHIPLLQASGRSHWVLEIGYPALTRVEVFVLRHGRLVQHATLGNSVPGSLRPMRTRTHAAPIELHPAADQEIYLRVQTLSAMIVPLTLYPAAEFPASESGAVLLQGLMLGVTLMFLAYSLAHGLALRDPVFAWYGVMLLGVGTFFLSYSGLGHQFVWTEHTDAMLLLNPCAVLVGVAGGCMFVTEALALRRVRPWVALGLQVTAIVSAVVIGLAIGGWIEYRATAAAASLLGPVPVLLALHESLRQARQGNRMAWFMALGWSAYTVGALTLAALLRGWLPAEPELMHLFQASSLAEQLAWLRVLALRIEFIQREAQQAQDEKSALQSMAYTDALTGLPNRRGLAAALEATLAARAPDDTVAVYLLDLDGFKAVNDSHGHEVGDALLVQVARRLRTTLRGSDLVARLGGDEFVVVPQGVTDEAAALRVGAKLLEAFREPFVVEGKTCRVGLTVGMALAPEEGHEAGELLRRADAAMYQGKQGGRNCVRRSVAVA